MVFLLMPMSLKKTYCFVHHVEMISGFLNKIFVPFKKKKLFLLFIFFFHYACTIQQTFSP